MHCLYFCNVDRSSESEAPASANTMNGNSVCISVYKLPLPLPELLYNINEFIFNECHLTRLLTVLALLLIYFVNI